MATKLKQQSLKAWLKSEAPAVIKIPKLFPSIKFHKDVLWFIEGNLFGLIIGFLVGFFLIKMLLT
jgi:hypothetical protein